MGYSADLRQYREKCWPIFANLAIWLAMQAIWLAKPLIE
jgi:hypothetical protein